MNKKDPPTIMVLFPKSIVSKYSQMLLYAGMEQTHVKKYLSTTLLIAFFAGLLSFIFFSITSSGLIPLLVAVIAVILTIAISYITLVLKADSRARAIEKVLPDALQLMSANIRAGMTVDKALWLCARSEFGPLEKELRRMASETIGGKPMSEAMQNAAKRVRSRIFSRAIILLVQGLELGGELAPLLNEISSDIRNTNILNKEIGAATSMYTVFIVFASVLAAPILFSVSTFYVETTAHLWGAQTVEAGTAVGTEFMKLTGPNITVDEVRFFATTCIFVTTFFGALAVGMIKHGQAKRGAKFVPIFVLVALLVYFAGYTIIRSMFARLLI